jgi:flagellar basal body-associated protein FliL
MSEEEQQGQEHNDGTWSGLKKTIVGTLGTVVAGGGVFLSTLLFGGQKEEEKSPAQQPSIIINNTQQQQTAAGGKTVVIKEAAKPTQPAPAPKKKDGDEFKEKPAQW